MTTTIHSSDSSACGRLVRRAFAPHEFSSLVDTILLSEDERDGISSLRQDDAQALIDVLDKTLDGPGLPPQTWEKCLKLLYRTCGRHELLPKSLTIPVCYDVTRDALYRGGYADIRKANYRGQDVAVKVIRTYSDSDLPKIVGRFCKEAVTWKFLRHPNVMPLMGVTKSESRFAMISNWMANGNINDFAKSHPEADRLVLLMGVTKGLIYIHNQGMIHGDLKGANILIDQNGNACITDFGLLIVISDPANPSGSASHVQGGTARWMSPEIIDPQRFGLKNGCPTTSSDCYALGMVIYETISGHIPFHELADIQVFVNVLKGGRPLREDRFTDNIWKMLKRCWASHPKKRPSIEDVLRCLEEAPNASDATKLRRLPFFPKSRPRPSSSTTPLITPRGSSILPELASIRNLNPQRPMNPPSNIQAVVWHTTSGPSRRYTREEPPFRTGGPITVPNVETLREITLPPATPLSQVLQDSRLDSPSHPVDAGDPQVKFGHRPRTESGGDARFGRTKRVLDALKRSRSVSTDPPDNGPIHRQDPKPLMTLPVAIINTPIARHRAAFNPGSIAENLEYNGSTPGATSNFQMPQPPSNSPYLFHPIPAEVSEDESDPESDPESTHPISDSPPRLPHFLTPGGNYMSTFIRDFNLGATIGSPPRRPPSLTRSRTSSVMAEHGPGQEQDFQRSMSPPPASRGDTRNWTEAGERKESPPGRNKSPQEVWNSMEVHRHETQEESPHRNEGSTSTGSQQQEGEYEATFPQTSSSSRVIQDTQDPERDIQRSIDEIDIRLGNHILPDRKRQRLFNELCKTCSRYHMLPMSMYIPDCSEGSVEVAWGGSAIVYQSMYKGLRVAVKVIRLTLSSDLDEILSRFCREGVAWKHLRHPNILPLLGVTVGRQRFAMVSEWMDNGNINQFIGMEPHANRLVLLVDIANGLKYLHDLQIVHGDLKGANILISNDKRACITDFGLVTIGCGVTTRAAARSSQISLMSTDSLMPFTSGGTYRWMSPELLDPEAFGIGVPHSEESNRPTTQSDCYAFGMVIYEILCGHHPFIDIVTDIFLIDAIVVGARPEKPEGAAQLGFTKDLWRILERCWMENRSARPSVEEILPYLNDATSQWYFNTVTSNPPATPGPSRMVAQLQDMCEYCQRRQKCRRGNRVYPYCGLTCAQLASGSLPVAPPTSPPLSWNSHSASSSTSSVTTCQTPGCTSPASTDPNGTPSNYCSVAHKRLGELGCISCRIAPSSGVFSLCQFCHDNAMIVTPVIVEIAEDHETHKSVRKQFQQSWRHDTACPGVCAIYQIIGTEASLKRYQTYLGEVEARGDFVAMGKAPGNEIRRWQGTKRKCYIGDSGITTFCADPECSLCRIIQTSYFPLERGKFGTGVYTSSASSKSNDYSKNVNINSEWKAMLLNNVVVGYGKKLTQRNHALTEPPLGYDSVLGEVSPGKLDYDRVVVYDPNAVRPSYLVMYQSL